MSEKQQPVRKKVNEKLINQYLVARIASLELENATLKALLNEKEVSTNGHNQ